MKNLNRCLPLLLAGLLQTMPLLRTALPAMQNAAGPAWAYVFPWVAGGLAFLGYDAVSSASSISVSPPTATVGVFYSGTVTYSGGHAGSVNSFSLSNSTYSGSSWYCLSSGSPTLVPGLTMSYPGSGNMVTISGTPTGSASTNLFRLIAGQYAGCSTSGEHDYKEDTTLIVLPVGGAQYAPSFATQPQNDVAQVGSTVILSGGAVGNPTPGYYWKQGINFIPNATNNTLTITNVQLTNAGIYTLVASNSVQTAVAAAFLSVVQTPGSNILALDYTNYYPAGTQVTMSSMITNISAATNSYVWDFNYSAIGVTTSNLTITAGNLKPSLSGTYSVLFNSTVPLSSLPTGTNTTIVSAAEYDSYWEFGYVPGFTNAPASISTNLGATVTLGVNITGTLPTVFWYQNGTNLVATQTPPFNPPTTALNTLSTNVSLVLSNVTAANAGTYTVVLTNYWGSITSAPAVLTLASALTVSAPAGETNYAGNTVSLTATAAGSGTLNYHWLKGSAPLANGGTVSGVTTTNLVIAPAAVTDSGSYSLLVTNTSGSVTSSVALVSILPVPAVSATLTGDSVSLSGTGGIPNRSYVVETTTNLIAPASWVPIQTNVASPTGVISFTTTNNPGLGQEFFQLEFP